MTRTVRSGNVCTLGSSVVLCDYRNAFYSVRWDVIYNVSVLFMPELANYFPLFFAQATEAVYMTPAGLVGLDGPCPACKRTILN